MLGDLIDIRRKHSDAFEENASQPIDEPSAKKKRGRKPNSQRLFQPTTDPEIEYEYRPVVISAPPLNLPPLSNFELKQIVEGLINHPQAQTLSFDEAQSFASHKAIDIGTILFHFLFVSIHALYLVYENHHYRMIDLSPEWFYDAILLKYPSVVFQYHFWFDHINPTIIPDGNDPIQLKQWQIALMIQAKQLVNGNASS